MNFFQCNPIEGSYGFLSLNVFLLFFFLSNGPNNTVDDTTLIFKIEAFYLCDL